MTKYQFMPLVIGLGFLILLMLWLVIPAWGWGVICMVVLSYGLCWFVERAIRRVWRR